MQQSTLMLVKPTGRRSTANIASIIAEAQQFGVPVHVIAPGQVSWREELELTARAAVVFTSAGGISFGLSFMNPRSVGIIIDYWGRPADGKPGASVPFDGFWWENLNAFHNLNYVLNVGDGPRARLEYSAEVHHVNTTRFAAYVCHALQLAEQAYCWSGTFD